MAIQSLELGTAPDDGTGDSLRVGGDKINDNFVELYTALGDGDALSSGISASATVITLISPVITTPTTTSAADADFVLINDGGILKKITTANLGIGGTAGSVAADDIGTGDAAVTIATSAGNITIDAQANNTDIIFKGTDGSSDITALTLDMSDAGKAIFTGAISATTITLSADGGVIVPDNGNIGSASATAAMQIASTGIVTFVDDIIIKDGGTIGAASAVAAMTISSGGIVTFVDDILIKDAGTIGSASAATAITIASSGIVTLVDDLILKDAATIGVTSSTGAIAIASTGIVTFVDDILIKDAGTIGSASAATAITIASSGIVTLVDDLILKDAATIGVTSSTSAITIAATGIVTLVDDLLLKDACTIGTATTAGAIAIAADGTVDLDTAGATVASAIIKTAGKESIWVPAAAIQPTTSNGCSALTTVETTSGRPDMVVLDFATGADEFAQFSIAFPKSWNLGTITYQAFWSGIAASTDCDWSLQGVAMNDNQTIDVAYGTAVVVSDNAQGAVE